MAPLDVRALNVEGSGAEAVGHAPDFGGGYEQEYRGGIDEAPDQPGAGDAIDLRAGSRDP